MRYQELIARGKGGRGVKPATHHQRLGYEMDSHRIGVLFPAETTDFSLLHVIQTGAGARPTWLSSGYRGLFPRGKAVGP
jgi:hypothetical protein